MFRYFAFIVITITSASTFAATIDFEDLSLPANSFHNNGSFISGGAGFNNSFTDFGNFTAWDGFSYSNTTDTTTPGYLNQYSAIPGHGAGGSATYGVGYYFQPPAITIPMGSTPVSIELTNTTYAYLSMRDGDGYGKKFGGVSGNDADFFKLTITGKDPSSAVVGAVNFMLADFTFANNASDYIVDQWTSVDLTSLSGSQTLEFSFLSSDNDDFNGPKTPIFIAIDNLVLVPEPSIAAFVGLLICASRLRRSK